MPLRDDYVVRQLRGIAAMIARMVGLRLNGETDEARAELERAYALLLGPQAELVGRVNASTAVRLIGSRDKIRAFAELISEEAEQEKDENRRAWLRARAAEFRRHLEQEDAP